MIGPEPGPGPVSPGPPYFIEEATGRGVRFTSGPGRLPGCIVGTVALILGGVVVALLFTPRTPLGVYIGLGLLAALIAAFAIMLLFVRVVVDVSRDGVVIHERPFGGDKNGTYAPRDIANVAWVSRPSTKGRTTYHLLLMLENGRTIEPAFEMSHDGHATFVAERLRIAIRNAGGKC